MQHNDTTEFKSLPRVVLLLLLMVALAACSTTSKVNDNQLAQINQASNQDHVSGFVVESDGATPVFGATIAILGKRAEAFIQRAEPLQPCISPAKPNINFVCSKEDGSFELDISKIQEFPITISIEKEDKIQEISLNKKDLNRKLSVIAMAAESTTIKKKVAVVMDFYNPIKEIQKYINQDQGDTQEVVLQLMNEYQNLFEISKEENDVSYPTFYSLFVDADNDGKADILDYDIVYINSRHQSDISLLDETLRAKLLEFISNGGNLQITEWTVEIEQEEPSLDQYI